MTSTFRPDLEFVMSTDLPNENAGSVPATAALGERISATATSSAAAHVLDAGMVSVRMTDPRSGRGFRLRRHTPPPCHVAVRRGSQIQCAVGHGSTGAVDTVLTERRRRPSQAAAMMPAVGQGSTD